MLLELQLHAILEFNCTHEAVTANLDYQDYLILSNASGIESHIFSSYFFPNSFVGVALNVVTF